MAMLPAVSVVMPIRNEERYLKASVTGVLNQRYPGDLEIILVVGPSTDATRTIADELEQVHPIRIVDNPTGLTPHAMNLGIKAASHDIIVRVDAHGELADGYIETAVKLLAETGAANVGGRMAAQGQTPFEQAVAAAYNSPLGLGGGGFHLASTPSGSAETVFLGVFRRKALEEVGNYDESLLRAQDWELNYRLRKAGYEVYYCPDLVVTYRPRSTLRALAKQFFRTGQWRREVVHRYPETATARYLAPPIAVAGITCGTAIGAVGIATNSRWPLAGFLAPIGYFVGVLCAPLLIPAPKAAKKWLPLVLSVMHLSWGLGFLLGIRNGR